MAITKRRYQLLKDFALVSQFLINNYQLHLPTGNMPQPAWEYAHTHPNFLYQLTHRFGIWEDDGKMVGVANYEGQLGECFLNTAIGYEFLKEEMLNHAWEELFEQIGDKKSLKVYANSQDHHFLAILQKLGYEKRYEYPITVYQYQQGFHHQDLPQGFSFISLEDELDYVKINDVIWKGFDHGDYPDQDIDCRIRMMSGPHFKKDLTIVIKAPNGDYACLAGMWVDEDNHYAYLEPLATAPKYRRMGLATFALMESMKRTMKYQATYCYGGSREFYFSIGFKEVGKIQVWQKQSI